MNGFGTNFRITVFGESHGQCVGVVIDGVKPGLRLSPGDFSTDLDRRRGGLAAGSTPRKESDNPFIVSGLYRGYTTGAPLTIIFENGDTRAADYEGFRRHPRPSHADRTAALKYNGFNDPEGGGMFSGRMTIAIVAAGVVAKMMIPAVSFRTRVTEIGGIADAAQFDSILAQKRAAGDSVGGVVEVIASGVPAGLGEPFFDSVESVASHLLFSIPGVKGVEFGAGFEAARRTGSENNDPVADKEGRTLSNNDGGVNGGITNGNDVQVRVAFKPTPSIASVQHTYDCEAEAIMPLNIAGRHDVCIALRGAVAAEAALAVALADLSLCDARNERWKR